MRRPSPVVPGEVVAGKYRVDRVLGAGAMGVVVRALHIDLQQEVAIKFLHPELANRADSAERFRREAYSAARIPSEHVPDVFDAGELEGSRIPFIVMEYLQGRDLARELAARGPLPVAEAARHVLEACDAVGEAHARGIVHRDLKPANLFLAHAANGTQRIKVLDFGISKTLGTGPASLSITEPATLMGSPGYMSPEQLESSRNVDARTDIWSLGVILFELVTGALPFDGESVPQLIRSVIGGKRARLDELAPELAPLEPVVARCLQQERARRFQTVAELCEALSPLAQKPEEHPFSLGRTGAPSSQSGEASGGGATAAERQQPEVVPDSGWGWTHAMRRSSLGRTVVIAAMLGALGAIVFGQGRKLLRALTERAEPEAAARIEVSQTSALEPLPAPSPPEATSPEATPSPPEATPSGGTPLEPQGPSAPAPALPTSPVPSAEPAANPPPAPPATANPVVPPKPPPASPVVPESPAAAKPVPAPTPQASAQPPASQQATSQQATSQQATSQHGATQAAPSPSEAPAALGHDANAAREGERRAAAKSNPYEIEEFGGRE